MKFYYFFLFYSLFFDSLFGYSLGLEHTIESKKSQKYFRSIDIPVYEAALKITKISTEPGSGLKQREIEVHNLFTEGEQAWQRTRARDSYITVETFSYKVLCDATINFFISTNQPYKAIEYYNKLLTQSRKYFLNDIEILSGGELIDIYLSLGLLDRAELLIGQLDKTVQEYYELDSEDIEDNDLYSVALHYRILEYKMRLWLLMGADDVLLEKLQESFDFLLKYYEVNFAAPFVTIEGMFNSSEGNFKAYTKYNIEHEQYYINDTLLYLYALYFTKFQDKKRADVAHELLEKALQSNANDSINELANKEQNAYYGQFPSFAPVVLKRIPLKYHYLQAFYEAYIAYENKNYLLASKQITVAKSELYKLEELYEKIPKEYRYMDQVLQTKGALQNLEANIFEAQEKLHSAYEVYNRLIQFYEKQRASLPVKFRRSFFRGYSKHAYIGSIRVSAKIYDKERSAASFENLIASVNLLNARQFKDLRYNNTFDAQNLSQLQMKLAKTEAIYILYDLEDQILRSVITKSKTTVSLIKKSKNFNHMLYELKEEVVNQKGSAATKTEDLSKFFTTPLRDLDKIETVYLLSDGIVSILPLEVYSFKSGLVFDYYNVVYLTLLDIPSQSKVFQKAKLLSVADPLYSEKSGYFIPLHETKQEALTISKYVNSSKILTGNKATKENFFSLPLEYYNIIHFATHGVLGGDIPDIDEPALVMTSKDDKDVFLRASEIAKLDLNASLVVLSACNTGSGRYFRGEGITGMARAFKLAGSNAVIASLWSVDSYATTKLMENLYRFLAQGYTESEALRLAKQQLRGIRVNENTYKRGLVRKDHNEAAKINSSYSLPYFWAPFVLVY